MPQALPLQGWAWIPLPGFTGSRPASAINTSFHSFLIAQLVKNPSAMQETLVQFPGREDPLEKG